MANSQPSVNSAAAGVNLNAGQLPTKGAAVNPAAVASKADEDQDGIYINEVNVYEFMRHADNGTGGFLFGQYLTSHSRERDFKERRNYSYYLNFVRRILNALTKPIYREEPVRKLKGETQFWDMFQKNCDRRGHTFNEFMKKVARKTKRYGVYFVVIDNDKAEALAKTEAEALTKKQHPYVYCYSPEDICEYEWDDLQRLSKVTFREWFANAEGKKVWRYREWTKDLWVLYEMEDDVKGGKRRKEIERGSITIGEIPIVPVYDEEPDEEEDPVLPHPPLYHIGRTNLAVFDVCSELRELERNQMFSLLRIPLEAGGKLAAIEVGTKNAIGYPKDASQGPDYISPDPDIARAIMDDRKFLIEQMFEMASLVGIVGMVVKQESGRAKEWEFQSSREELTRFGHLMERAEREIVRIFGLYLQKKDLELEVNYSENYGLVDMTAETEAAAAALALNISPRVNVEIKKDWTLKNFRDSKDDLIQELLDSIDRAALDEAAAATAAADQAAKDQAAADAATKAAQAAEAAGGSTGASNGNEGGDGEA